MYFVCARFNLDGLASATNRQFNVESDDVRYQCMDGRVVGFAEARGFNGDFVVANWNQIKAVSAGGTCLLSPCEAGGILDGHLSVGNNTALSVGYGTAKRRCSGLAEREALTKQERNEKSQHDEELRPEFH